MTRKAAVFLVFAALSVVHGCGVSPPTPRFAMRYEKGWDKSTLADIIARAGSGEVAVVSLGSTAWVSHHVAIVRTEEHPHYHRFHDLTVTVLQGEGILTVEHQRIAMRAGDVAHVQRGIPHFFRNTGKQPAAAFVVFSPPFDGRDTVTAEPQKTPEAPPKKKGWWPFGRR
jgi:mannose-6-phosphate isomerase-like protein (cupin superfamily)